jgi:hypothetical protein
MHCGNDLLLTNTLYSKLARGAGNDPVRAKRNPWLGKAIIWLHASCNFVGHNILLTKQLMEMCVLISLCVCTYMCKCRSQSWRLIRYAQGDIKMNESKTLKAFAIA